MAAGDSSDRLRNGIRWDKEDKRKMKSVELKATQRPFEENAYKYADKQAELYRGLKEPNGGYANIIDAYIVGATDETRELKRELEEERFVTEDLKKQIEKMKCCGNCANLCGCGLRGYEECKNFDKWEMKEND